jgi:peptidoglycan/xylan/chitin deacetylase (PgdA/CDA1 family)
VPARLAASAAACAGAWALPAYAPNLPWLAARLGIAMRTAHPGAIALTFDDGPHPEGTPAVLDALDRAGARATFFLVGERVERAPHVAREIVARGHAVAIHGYRHRSLMRLGPRAIDHDLDRAAELIGAATGLAPTLHRAPYGTYSWPSLRAVRRRGWTPVLWTRWGRDWSRRATPASIARLAAGDLRDGDVVLLHDADDYAVPGSWRRTVAALPAVLDAAAARGLACAPLTGAADLVAPSGR